MQFNAMNVRKDRIESGLEQKIASKVAQVFDKRITGEVNKLKKTVDDKIESVKSDTKADLSSDIEALNDKIGEMSSFPRVLMQIEHLVTETLTQMLQGAK